MDTSKLETFMDTPQTAMQSLAYAYRYAAANGRGKEAEAFANALCTAYDYR